MTRPRRVVYLLHFERPYKHARHYLGSTDDLRERLEQHVRGTGARLLAVVRDAGIAWTIARTWQGDRTLERRLKRHGGMRRLCPRCTPGTTWGNVS